MSLSLAHKESLRSEHKYRHGAVLVRSGRILAKGYNIKKTHPTWGSGYKKRLHAETVALREAINRGVDTNGAIMYVCRSDFGISAPCKKCDAMLKRHGVKRVIHT